MKRIFFALLLVAAPLHAQAESQFTNFALTSTGFSTTLLFRNVNPFTDVNVVGIQSVHVGMSARLLNFCTAFETCVVTSSPVVAFGNAQTSTFVAAGSTFGFAPFSISSCASFGCAVGRFFTAQLGTLGVLGCALPGPTGGPQQSFYNYTGRTCPEVGLDGWLALNVGFSYIQGNNAAPTFAFAISDLTADFGRSTVAVTATPEPATLALVGLGLMSLATMRTARRSGRRS
ncbi:MAG: PEP-CTERM sorting domain-containing protein [Gemmatimonas sp.]